MREIKFRAFVKESPDKQLYKDNTMYEWDDVADDCNWFIKCNDLQVGSFELMQYTGLKDKNGVEIYEGDIVEDYLRKPAIVMFGDYMADGKDYYASSAYGFYAQHLFEGKVLSEEDTETLSTNHTVLGNIYQNKDLIK